MPIDETRVAQVTNSILATFNDVGEPLQEAEKVKIIKAVVAFMPLYDQLLRMIVQDVLILSKRMKKL